MSQKSNVVDQLPEKLQQNIQKWAKSINLHKEFKVNLNNIFEVWCCFSFEEIINDDKGYYKSGCSNYNNIVYPDFWAFDFDIHHKIKDKKQHKWLLDLIWDAWGNENPSSYAFVGFTDEIQRSKEYKYHIKILDNISKKIHEASIQFNIPQKTIYTKIYELVTPSSHAECEF